MVAEYPLLHTPPLLLNFSLPPCSLASGFRSVKRMEAAPESGLPPRLEAVYTPKVHADVPGRGERLQSPALFLFTLTSQLCANFQFLIRCQSTDWVL